jgi:hypothetical protein
VIYDELSLWDAPKWCTGFSENPVFMHLLEHPFFLCHRNQRIIQASPTVLGRQGHPAAEPRTASSPESGRDQRGGFGGGPRAARSPAGPDAGKAVPLGCQRTIGQPPGSGAGGDLPVSFLPGSGGHQLACRAGAAPAVVARKVWGGSRTERRARTQQILASLLATCHQRNHPTQAALIGLLCSAELRPLDLTAADLPPPRLPPARRPLRNLTVHVGHARRTVARR